MNDLALMIQTQADTQRNHFGVDLQGLTGAARVQALKDNVLAALDELHEVLAESSWKPWQHAEYLHEDAAFGELVDLWCFTMNLMLIVDPTSTPSELAERLTTHYFAKRNVNVLRQADGYTGVKDANGRATDEPTVFRVTVSANEAELTNAIRKAIRVRGGNVQTALGT